MLAIFHKSDAKLVHRTLKGQREAFTPLVERYQEIVFAVAYGIVANAADAEDVTQDTFVTAFTQLAALREPEKFRSWLLTIARNRASDILVKRKRETPLDNLDYPATNRTDDVADAELRALLRDRIEKLPAEHREILLLHYYAGLKVREVAAQLEISTEAAKKRLQRARDLLSQRMLAQLRDTLDEQGSSAARTRTIVGLIAGASAPWLGGGAAAAGAGLLTGAKLLKFAAGTTVSAGVLSAMVLATRPPQPEPPRDPPVTSQSEVTSGPVDGPVAATDFEPEAPAGEFDVSASIEDASAENSGAIRGRVVDESGAPQAGIPVRAHRSADQHETTTDEKGRFTFERVRAKGLYLLQALGEHRFASGEVTLGYPAYDPLDVQLVLLPAATLTGVVLDSDGDPLSDIPVTPIGHSVNGKHEPLRHHWRTLRRVKTDSGGKFAIPYAQLGGWTLEVDAPDYEYLMTTKLETDASPHTIRLKKGATVRGRVVHRGTDKGVPGLELKMGEREGRTDGDGNFTIRGVSQEDSLPRLRGNHNLLITSPPIAVFPGQETARATVEVVPGGVITGRVVDAKTGAPVPLAWAQFKNARGFPSTANETDEDGYFELTRLAPGEYTLSDVSANGYAPIIQVDAKPIKVNYGSREVHADILVTKGVTLSGRVEPSEGGSHDTMHVNVLPAPEEGAYGRLRSSSLLPDGSFSISGLPRTGKVLLQLTGPGWTSNGEGPFDLANGDISGIRLRALSTRGATGSVAGRVVQGGTLPLAGRTVSLSGIELEQTTDTGDDGAFQFAEVPYGTYQLIISEHSETEMTIQVQSGQSTSNVLLALGSGTGTVSGRVEDWRGEALANVRIRANSPGRSALEVRTDSTGRYAIPGLGDGPLRLEAHIDGFSSERREDAAINSGEVNFVLKAVGHVEGTVVDARTGAPITEFEVQTVRGARQENIDFALRDGRGQRQVSSEGIFRALDLAAGENAIVVRAPGYYPGHAKVSVLPDEVVDGTTIQLERSEVQTLRVTDSAGNPVTGASVFVNNLSDFFEDDALKGDVVRTDDDGSARLNHLIPGTNMIYVYHHTYGRGVLNIDTRRQRGEVALNLPASGRLEGKLLMNGEPIASEVRLTVQYPESTDTHSFSRYSAEVQEDGSFVIEGLMPGTATLEADWNPGMRFRRELSIEPHATTTLDLDLPSGNGRIAVEIVVPEQWANLQFSAMAVVEDANGEFIISRELEEHGLLELENLPPGAATIRVAGGHDDGLSVGRSFAQEISGRETVSITADFTVGVAVSGSLSNFESGRGSAVMFIEGAVESAQLANESIPLDVSMRMTHWKPLDGQNTFRFDAVTPGMYTLVVALDQTHFLAVQSITVGVSDLYLELGLP